MKILALDPGKFKTTASAHVRGFTVRARARRGPGM